MAKTLKRIKMVLIVMLNLFQHLKKEISKRVGFCFAILKDPYRLAGG